MKTVVKTFLNRTACALLFMILAGAAQAAQFTVTQGYAGTASNGNSIDTAKSFADLGIGRVVVTDGTSGSTFSNGTCNGQGNVLCMDVYIYDTSNTLIATYLDATSDWQRKTSNVTNGFSIEGLTPTLSIGGFTADSLFLVIPMRTVTPSGTSGSYAVNGSADPFDAADANLVLSYLSTVAPKINGPTTNSDLSATDTKSVQDGTTDVFTFTADEPVTWSISGGSDASLFSIDANGKLTFNTAPTYDPQGNNEYVVEIMATDADGIPVTMTLTVTVVPQDAVAPVINGPTGTAATDAKSIPEGTTDVFTFTADQTVTWSINGGADAALFSIGSNGKLVFLTAPVFDPEGTNEYVVVIEAEDAASNITTMTVTITVTDATAPVIAGPTGTDPTDERTIPEGTTDVYNFTADETVTWSVAGGAHAGLFHMTAGGTLAFLTAPVYDPQGTNQYVVVIEAEDGAGNVTAMTITVTVADTAEGALDRAREEIEEIISDAEVAKLRNQQSSLRSLTQSARDRLSGGGCGGNTDDATTSANSGDETCRDERDRTFNMSANGETLSISGSNRLTVQRGNTRRLTQIDVQVSQENGLTNLSLNGKVAFELQPSDRALYGIFLGANLSRSEGGRSLRGTLDFAGLTLGAYAVNEVVENIFSEAYAAVGKGRNMLQLGDGNLVVDGSYDSTELHLGWIASGRIERGKWEYWPELALQWSRSQTSPLSLTGSIPAGTTAATWEGLRTTLGTVTLATDVIYKLGGETDPWRLRIKPGIQCEELRGRQPMSDCGATVTFGIDHNSDDGRHRLAAEATVEKVGVSTGSSATLSYEFRF